MVDMSYYDETENITSNSTTSNNNTIITNNSNVTTATTPSDNEKLPIPTMEVAINESPCSSVDGSGSQWSVWTTGYQKR
eukprot:UN03074